MDTNVEINPIELHNRRIDHLAGYAYDMYGWVMDQFPWGEKDGPLEKDLGPENWQIELMEKISNGIDPSVLMAEATSSGHGIGKSALVAWIILWGISTYTDARAVITANTEAQLTNKTWPELSKWYHMMRDRDLFKYTATSLFSVLPGHEKNWRADLQPWSETRPESFAGLHNKGKRAIVLFDEASSIAPKVWETTEGAFTDSNTERLWCVFGNPTRADGRFRDCWGRHRKAWGRRKIDSRNVRLSDKEQIDKWKDAYGEDSDWFRVRVRGEFPRVGFLQFIPSDLVQGARKRLPNDSDNSHHPLLMGVDIARFGTDSSVIKFRRGTDAKNLPTLKFDGMNLMALAQKVFDAWVSFKPDYIYVDETGIGAGVVDRLMQMRVSCVIGINFSWKPDGVDFDGTSPKYANKRAEMYGRTKAWLPTGCINDDDDLEADLTKMQYGYNGRMEIQLESKDDMRARGEASPDEGDALALTFAQDVPMLTSLSENSGDGKDSDWDYDPFAKKDDQ